MRLTNHLFVCVMAVIGFSSTTAGHSTQTRSGSRRLLAPTFLKCDFPAAGQGITCTSTDYTYCCGRLNNGPAANTCSYQRGGFINQGTYQGCFVDPWLTPSCCLVATTGYNAVAAGGQTAASRPSGGSSSGDSSTNFGNALNQQQVNNNIVTSSAAGAGTYVNTLAIG